MNFAAFAELSVLASAAGFNPIDARYDTRVFGSWHLVIQLNRVAFRVIWDGKDGWLVIETAPAKSSPFRGDYEWSLKRVLKTDAERQLPDIVAYLRANANA